MSNLFLNLAIIKTNYDENLSTLLDNYMPLVGHAISLCDGDIVAINEVTAKLEEVAQFRFPEGVVSRLVKRAAKRKYQYVVREERLYRKNHDALSNLDFSEKRAQVMRSHSSLRTKFQKYCKDEFQIEISNDEIDRSFFDILFEISPKLAEHINFADAIDWSDVSQVDRPLRYRLYRFIKHVNETDQEGFDAINSFVQGAVLTETFYYIDPDHMSRRFNEVGVYFDTRFLFQALGKCDKSLHTPCRELVDMLALTRVRMYCFRITFDEMRGILDRIIRRYNTISSVTALPGRIEEYYYSNDLKRSDVELDLAQLESKLGSLGVKIVDTPNYEDETTPDERKLDSFMDEHLPGQSESAKRHDMRCFTAIFQLRRGQNKKYLQSCKAIFITTNAGVARASTAFFNSEYGPSDAPICMTDHIFTSLVWLKAIEKKPNLPKEILIANSFAAMNPSEALWRKYAKEANKLRTKGDITADDYIVMVHSQEARSALMEQLKGDEAAFAEGTPEQVLKRAREKHLEEKTREIENISRLKDKKIDLLTRFIQDDSSNMDLTVKKIHTFTEKIIRSIYLSSYYLILSVFIVLLAASLIITIPGVFLIKTNLEEWQMFMACAGLLLVILTFFNLVFGTYAKEIADKIAGFLAGRARRYLNNVWRGFLGPRWTF